MVEFKNKILFVGFGAVAQCTLPILEKHIKVPLSNITVMDFENQEGLLKSWTERGLKWVRDRVTREPALCAGSLMGAMLTTAFLPRRGARAGGSAGRSP